MFQNDTVRINKDSLAFLNIYIFVTFTFCKHNDGRSLFRRPDGQTLRTLHGLKLPQ